MNEKMILDDCMATPIGDDAFAIFDRHGLSYEQAMELPKIEILIDGSMYFSPMRLKVKMKDFPQISRDGGTITDKKILMKLRNMYDKGDTKFA